MTVLLDYGQPVMSACVLSAINPITKDISSKKAAVP